MKIVLLSAASSIHTVRWANGLSEAGHEVFVISQHENIDPFLPSVSVYTLPFLGVLGLFHHSACSPKIIKKYNLILLMRIMLAAMELQQD